MEQQVFKIGDSGEQVREIQMALSGFDGGVFDGKFGPATHMQVRKFQRDFMRIHPNGRVDSVVIKNIIAFGKAYPLNQKKLKCNCKKCDGHGNGINDGRYRSGMPRTEAYYKYEYPGIHRAVLWTAKAVMFYCREHYMIEVSSGYRCNENNKIHNRKSTNHFGKAIDLVIKNTTKESVVIDTNHAKNIIGINCNIQLGWENRNKKSIEPANISRSWIHLDVRSFEAPYLQDDFFVKTEKELYVFGGDNVSQKG